MFRNVFFSSDCFADPSLGTRGVVVAANGVVAAWANVEGQPAVRPAAMLRFFFLNRRSVRF